MSFKCAICSKEENSLLKVNHVKLGVIKICEDCWFQEHNKGKLLSLKGGCDCCR
jgi:ribosome-binding protein aMBF1 (putative translation factor)